MPRNVARQRSLNSPIRFRHAEHAGYFDDLQLGTDDVSQISQRTDPVASAGHETIPDLVPNLGVAPPEPEYSWPLLAVVLIPLLAAAGLLVASVVLKAVT